MVGLLEKKGAKHNRPHTFEYSEKVDYQFKNKKLMTTKPFISEDEAPVAAEEEEEETTEEDSKE